MLKKIILVVISLVAAGALGYYLANLVRDRATSPEALPEKVLTFISEPVSYTHPPSPRD